MFCVLSPIEPNFERKMKNRSDNFMQVQKFGELCSMAKHSIRFESIFLSLQMYTCVFSVKGNIFLGWHYRSRISPFLTCMFLHSQIYKLLAVFILSEGVTIRKSEQDSKYCRMCQFVHFVFL